MRRVSARGITVTLVTLAVCVCAPKIARLLTRRVEVLADRVATRRIEEAKDGIVREASDTVHDELVDRAAEARRVHKQRKQEPVDETGTPPAEPVEE